LKRIAIIGLGLIGGSLGLALKQIKLDAELVGYARSLERREKALKRGAVDKVEDDLISTVSEANLVILATPVLAMREILAQIGNLLPGNCVVTDTASTKVQVMEWAERYLPPRVSFIGGHPMAGKELSGIEAANASLFDHCTYCLVPEPNASPEAIQSVTDLVKRIGAEHLFLTASEHDNFVAGISHLPFLLSVALVSATTKSSSWGEMSKLAATGYRDLTRLTSQNPEMTQGICLTNQGNILPWIDGFAGELSRLRQLIADRSAELAGIFAQAQQSHQQWLEEYDKKDRTLSLFKR
jgi:prephenate dehydrogenase